MSEYTRNAATSAAAIADAIDGALKVEGANKYALASELTSLADRVKALEDASLRSAVMSAVDACTKKAKELGKKQ